MKLLSLVTYLLGGGVQWEVALDDVIVRLWNVSYIHVVAYLLGAQLEVALDIRVMK